MFSSIQFFSKFACFISSEFKFKRKHKTVRSLRSVVVNICSASVNFIFYLLSLSLHSFPFVDPEIK